MPSTARRFWLFDLMLIMTENSCLHSHVEGKISSWGTAQWASVKYEEAMLTKKFIGQHSLCFIYVLIRLDIYELLLFPGLNRQISWINREWISDVGKTSHVQEVMYQFSLEQ